MKIKRLLITIAMVAVLAISMAVPAMAAATADVTITATPEYLAITNSQATWTIGSIAESTTVWWTHDDTASADPYADTEGKSIATNTGSIASNIGAHVHNFTGGVGWTFAAVVGEDDVVMGIAFATEANKAAWAKFEDTTSIEIAHALAAAGHVDWAMYLDTGTFTDGVAKSCTLTLTITKHV